MNKYTTPVVIVAIIIIGVFVYFGTRAPADPNPSPTDGTESWTAFSMPEENLTFKHPETMVIGTSTPGFLLTFEDTTHPDLLVGAFLIWDDLETFVWNGISLDTFAYSTTTGEFTYTDDQGNIVRDTKIGETKSGDPIHELVAGDAGAIGHTFAIPQKSKDRVVLLGFGYDQENESIQNETQAFLEAVRLMATTIN